MKAEISRFDDELRNVAFIKAVCAAFQAKALEYYAAAVAPDERLQRLGEIGETLREIKFKDRGREFSISATQVKAAAAGAGALPDFTCPPGTVCIDGICVPIRGE